MKAVNYKFLQFLIVLCIGLVTGYFIADEDNTPVPIVTRADQKIETADDPLAELDQQYQQAIETEVNELRQRVAMLEQQLVEQQQADSLISEDDSEDSSPAEKLTVENLLKVGVMEMLAQDIIDRMSQHEFRLLDLHDRAKREGYLNSPRYRKERRELMAAAPSLRTAIGNDDYDRYLYTTGQNNRVTVVSAMSNSPADQYGVQKGDIVLSYANEKVLSWRDLRELTSKGVYGEYVNLNVLRNDQLINILVPRGPLGVKLGTTILDPETEYNY